MKIKIFSVANMFCADKIFGVAKNICCRVSDLSLGRRRGFLERGPDHEVARREDLDVVAALLQPLQLRGEPGGAVTCQ